MVHVVPGAAKHFSCCQRCPILSKTTKEAAASPKPYRKNITKCLSFTLVASFKLQQVEFTADSTSRTVLKP